jgi:predicted permease
MAWGFSSLLHISGPARQAAVVLASMPVAVTTSILAMKFDSAPDFVMSAIFLSTLLSPLTLTPIIAVLVR